MSLLTFCTCTLFSQRSKGIVVVMNFSKMCVVPRDIHKKEFITLGRYSGWKVLCFQFTSGGSEVTGKINMGSTETDLPQKVKRCLTGYVCEDCMTFGISVCSQYYLELCSILTSDSRGIHMNQWRCRLFSSDLTIFLFLNLCLCQPGNLLPQQSSEYNVCHWFWM